MASSEHDILFGKLLASVIEATNRHELGDEAKKVDEYYLLLERKIGEPSGLDFVEQELRRREHKITKRISSKESRRNTYRNLLEARLKADSLQAILQADMARDELSSTDKIKKDSDREVQEALAEVQEALAELRIVAARSTQTINSYTLQSHDRLLQSIHNPLREYYLWKTTALWLPRLTYLCVVFLVFVIGLTVVGSSITSIKLGLCLAISAWIFQEFIFAPYMSKWLERLRQRSLLNALANLCAKERFLCLAEAMLDKDLHDFH